MGARMSSIVQVLTSVQASERLATATNAAARTQLASTPTIAAANVAAAMITAPPIATSCEQISARTGSSTQLACTCNDGLSGNILSDAPSWGFTDVDCVVSGTDGWYTVTMEHTAAPTATVGIAAVRDFGKVANSSVDSAPKYIAFNPTSYIASPPTDDSTDAPWCARDFDLEGYFMALDYPDIFPDQMSDAELTEWYATWMKKTDKSKAGDPPLPDDFSSNFLLPGGFSFRVKSAGKETTCHYEVNRPGGQFWCAENIAARSYCEVWDRQGVLCGPNTSDHTAGWWPLLLCPLYVGM